MLELVQTRGTLGLQHKLLGWEYILTFFLLDFIIDTNILEMSVLSLGTCWPVFFRLAGQQALLGLTEFLRNVAITHIPSEAVRSV